MKKIFNALILAVVLCFSLLVTNVFAAEDVEIKSITLDSKSDNAVVNNEATYSGLDIAFDVNLKSKGDYVKYKVEVVNNSNEDYEISNSTQFGTGKYVKYDFSFDGNSNIIEKKSTKVMYITITYDKEVPEEKLVDGYFTENNEMVVNLANSNPKTGDGIVKTGLILLVSMIALVAIVVSRKTKVSKHLIMVVALALAVIPTTIYAAKQVQIKLNPSVRIGRNYMYILKMVKSYDCENPESAEPRLSSGEYHAKVYGANSGEEGFCAEDGYYTQNIEFNGTDTWEEVIEKEYNEIVEDYSSEEYEDGEVYYPTLEEFRSVYSNSVYLDEDLNNKIKLTDKVIDGHIYYFSVSEMDDKI